jgi:RNA polymerase sigma-70 factor (ECF subfamily)
MEPLVTDSSARGGNDQQDRFVRLLARYSPQIFGFILSLSPQTSDAEDIFQETSAALWKKFDTFEDGTSFRAWACRVAQIKVLDHRRKKYREHILSDHALAMIAADALVVAEQEVSCSDVLSECVAKLPLADRSLIELKYYRGKDPKQIAEASEKSVYTVYRALSRIHGALLRCVQRGLARDRVDLGKL